MTIDIPSGALQAFLDDLGGRYVVVKNPDLWGSLARGGDWDLLVEDIGDAKRTLKCHLGDPHREIRHSYCHAQFYPWGEIDLMADIAWKGCTLVPGRSVLADKVFDSSGPPRPRPAHEAMAAWIAPLLASGTFKPRYLPVIRHAVESDLRELRRCLERILSPSAVAVLIDGAATDYISGIEVRRIRRAVWQRSMREKPLSSSIQWTAFAIAETLIRLHPMRLAESPKLDK